MPKTLQEVNESSVCPHLNCLVYHNGNLCTCDMRRYCSQCKGELANDNNPEDNQLENKDWKEEAKNNIFNKLAFIGRDGEEYLDKTVFPFIQSLLSQQAEKQREIVERKIAIHRELEKQVVGKVIGDRLVQSIENPNRFVIEQLEMLLGDLTNNKDE